MSRAISTSLTPVEVKALSRKEKMAILADLRRRPQRLPSLVLLCTTELLASHTSLLGDEIWAIYEQGLVAAVDCGCFDKAVEYLAALKKRFGIRSTRVRKLAGLVQESGNDREGAKKTYNAIMNDCPFDPFPVKRMAAMLKSEGRYEDAVKVLEERKDFHSKDGDDFTMQDLYSTDDSVYRELLNLNLLLWRLPRAIYYAEEVVLLDPSNYISHTRHAELLYSHGDLERSASAFAQSLRLNDEKNNVRALYGLWMVTVELLQQQKQQKNSNSDAAAGLADVSALHQYAASKLRQAYSGSAQCTCLELLLRRQNFSIDGQ